MGGIYNPPAFTVDAVIFKGTINVAADFPTLGQVQNGWLYIINSNVTDNDPTKTNTGQSFDAGDEIVWNGVNWSDLGSVDIFVDDGTTISKVNPSRDMDFGTGYNGMNISPITGVPLAIKSTGDSTDILRLRNSGNTQNLVQFTQGSTGSGEVNIRDSTGALKWHLDSAGDSYWNDISATRRFGFGRSNPTYKVHVQGNLGLSDNIAGTTGLPIVIENTSGTGECHLRMRRVTDYDWRIIGKSALIKIRDNQTGTDIISIEKGAPSNSMYIDSAGNIGLGTNVPSEKLDVNGDTNLNSTTNSYKIGGLSILNVKGIYNLNIGEYAGNANPTGNTVCIGYLAGLVNTGVQSVYIGSKSGKANITGADNVYVGNAACSLGTTGSRNVYIGGAVAVNARGNDNIFIGYQAGVDNNTGTRNIFIGNNSGHDNATGSYNLCMGYLSGTLSTGSNNVLLGDVSGQAITTGSNNVFLGSVAGQAATTATGNIFIGYRAGYSETGNNKLYIENSSSATPLIYGEFDNDFIKINGDFEVVESVNLGGVLYVDDSGGKVGIGTSTPQELVHFADTIVGVRLEGTSAGDQYFQFMRSDVGNEHTFVIGRDNTDNKYKLDYFNAATGTLQPGLGLTAWATDSTGKTGFLEDTPTAVVHAAASTTARASFRIPNGTAPTSPNTGDFWSETDKLLYRKNASETINLMNITNPNQSSYFTGGAATTTILAADSPVKIVATWTEDNSDKFTFNSNGRFTYTGTDNVRFNITAQATLDPVTAAASTWSMYIAKNGTIIGHTKYRNYVVGGQLETSICSIAAALTTNDYIEIFVERNAGAGDIVITDGSISISKI